MLPIKSFYVTVLLLSSCSILAQCALEPATSTDLFADNPDEKSDDALTMHKRPSFFVGSRYGRSGAAAPLFASSKSRRLSVVPRNDRFFLGSRYGKRASEYMSPYEQAAIDSASSSSSPLASSVAQHLGTNQQAAYFGDGGNKSPYMMSCVYMGLRNLYRCNNIEEINTIMNQLGTAHSDDDREK